MQQILVPPAFAVNSAKKRVANLDDIQIQNKVTDLVRNTFRNTAKLRWPDLVMIDK